MRKTAFAAAALAAALSLDMAADSAAAMPSATPGQLGLATANTGLVQKTRVVCGRTGCRRVVRGANRVWVGPVAHSTALPARLGVGLAVLLGAGTVPGGAGTVRGGVGTAAGAGKLIAMTAGV
jgi:hypothetical protein